MLSRVKFAEVLVMVLKANDKVEHSPEKQKPVPEPTMEAIPETMEGDDMENEEEKASKESSESEPTSESDAEFRYSMHLGALFSQTI